jgi:hypothetical protein
MQCENPHIIQVRHAYVNVPVELSRYVLTQGLEKAFALYLFLKLFSDGKIHQQSSVFDELRRLLKMKDNRTFKNQIEKLKDLGWIGFNPASGYYFIRSFDHLRFKLAINNRQGTKLYPDDLKNIKAYLTGVVITAEIHGQKHAIESLQKKLAKTEVKQRDASKQSGKGQFIPQYFGLCNQSIADLLLCSKTRACQLKQAAELCGYINTTHQFKHFATLSKADYHLRNVINDMGPALRGRLRFMPGCDKNRAPVVHVFEQLYDEINPLLKITTLPKFGNLRISSGVRKKGSNVHSEIAMSPTGAAIYCNHMRRKGAHKSTWRDQLMRAALLQAGVPF